MKLTKEQIESAHEAIKKCVHKYLEVRQLLSEEADLCTKCIAYFKRHKHKFNPDRNESIEAFAMAKANSCLKHEARAVARENRRKKEYIDSLAFDRDEKAEKRLVKRLVMKAWEKLSDEQRGIIGWELCGFTIELLADIWKISKKNFFQNHVNPAREAFAEAFGEVVGNPELYAKLRAEVVAKKAKRKGQTNEERT